MTTSASRRLDAEILARIKRRTEQAAPVMERKPVTFLPHDPHPKQAEFLALDCFEALYGGAAGGGKSDALLMAAAQYVHVPGYAALLLRRTYPDLALPGAIMDRAKAWWVFGEDPHAREGWTLPAGIHWNDKDKRFTFPSGATISFGYMDNELDRQRYKSAEFQFIGFDELTDFPEHWYTFLLSRIRRKAGVEVPLRARGASNPGGIGHDWVYNRFVDGGIARAQRTFIPALLADNPFLDQVSYLASLSNLDPTTRQQLEKGLWIRDAQGLVYSVTDDNLIDAPPPELRPDAPDKIRGSFLLAQDYGTTNATSWTIWGWRPHDQTAYMLRSWKKTGIIPSENGEIVERLDKVYRFEKMVGDIGGLGKGYIEEARRRFRLPLEAARKENKRGYIKLYNGELARRPSRIQIVRPECLEYLAEASTLRWNADQTAEAPGYENHCTDGGLYGWRAVPSFDAQPAPKPPEDPGIAELDRLLAEQDRRKQGVVVDQVPRWRMG